MREHPLAVLDIGGTQRTGRLERRLRRRGIGAPRQRGGAIAVALRPEAFEAERVSTIGPHHSAKPETRLPIPASLAMTAKHLRLIGGLIRHPSLLRTRRPLRSVADTAILFKKG
jgi:hypothetical protein